MAGYRRNRYYSFRFAPYVSVERRRRQAAKRVAAMAKKGLALSPVSLEGRAIANTFWGRAWCKNLESYSDFSNRLPRGRTYVRNGSVIDLSIGAGKVKALVSGSSIYEIEIGIEPVARSTWKKIRDECAGKIDSYVELLQGRFSRGVMEVMTRRKGGLFPTPDEISMSCSCPDDAIMCKHVAATLYGVGARLDERPELLFTLRAVDPLELLGAAVSGPARLKAPLPAGGRVLAGADLSGIFGIDLDTAAGPDVPAVPRRGKPRKARGVKARRGKNSTSRTRAARNATVTAKDLVSRGIPHSTIQNWLRAGVLVRSGERGVYQTTPETQTRIAEFLARGAAS